jgi:HK97 gp10 family phage protein
VSGEVEVIGMDDIKKLLTKLTPKHAANLSKSLIHGLAAVTAKEAKKRVQKDTGTLKKAIKAKRKRSKPGEPISDVVVEHGNDVKSDGFYWRFVEFGTNGSEKHSPTAAKPFLTPAKLNTQAKMPQIIDEQFTKKLSALIKREQKKKAKKT